MMKNRIVLLAAVGMSILLNGCGIFHLRGTIPNYEEQIYTPSTSVRKVILQDEDVLVRICNSETKELYLSYYDADDGSERYEIIEDGEILTVAKEAKVNQGIFIFGDQYSSDSYKEVKLTLFIPNDYQGDVSVRTKDGDIEIGDVTVDHLKVVTKDGDVFLNNTTVTQNLSCSTKDGNVEGILNGNESQYNINIRTKSGNGKTNSNTSNEKAIDITTKDGDVGIAFN